MPGDAGWLLRGTVTGVLEDARAYALQYEVSCAPDWVTRSAVVSGHVSATTIATSLAHDRRSGQWTRDGVHVPEVDGCLDVDLGFSPSTNTLPIRRLALPVGAEAPVRAAWLQFPSFALEPLEQVYRRVAERRYEYQSGGGRFRADLEVDAAGIVRRYGEYWIAVDAGPAV
jgi:hypothetical protein